MLSQPLHGIALSAVSFKLLELRMQPSPAFTPLVGLPLRFLQLPAQRLHVGQPFVTASSFKLGAKPFQPPRADRGVQERLRLPLVRFEPEPFILYANAMPELLFIGSPGILQQ